MSHFITHPNPRSFILAYLESKLMNGWKIGGRKNAASGFITVRLIVNLSIKKDAILFIPTLYTIAVGSCPSLMIYSEFSKVSAGTLSLYFTVQVLQDEEQVACMINT
jgi:hypothetical protein